VLLLSLFCAFVFGLIFLLFTTFPMVFEEQYGFSAGVSGLSYLGLGIGMGLGLVLFGALSDKLLQKNRQGESAKPEGRLQLMVWFCPLVPIGFFWYGWSAYEHTHWIVPILGTFFIGLGSLFVIIPGQTYMVDAFGPAAAASALAANTVLRNLFGAFIPLAGPPTYAKLGLGWGNSLLGFICLVFLPVPIFFYRYGGWLRERFVVEL
jgi:MFS family permease